MTTSPAQSVFGITIATPPLAIAAGEHNKAVAGFHSLCAVSIARLQMGPSIFPFFLRQAGLGPGHDESEWPSFEMR
jgi:hypothetical protein